MSIAEIGHRGALPEGNHRGARPERNADEREASEAVLVESLAWVERTCDELTAAGRSVCGGWPGTVSEARRLVVLRLCSGPDPAVRGGVEAREVERTAHVLYANARRIWLERAALEDSQAQGEDEANMTPS